MSDFFKIEVFEFATKLQLYERQSEMIGLNAAAAAAFVILFMISWINCDICDVCMCSKNDCIEAENDTSIGQCADQLNEYVFCNGSEENVKTEGTKFNLNSIPWPKHNTKTILTTTFNHFKVTYLSK